MSFEPYTCPVCCGRGTVPPGFYSQGSPSSSLILSETCRSCLGQGFLWPPGESSYTVSLGQGIEFTHTWSELGFSDEELPATGHLILKDAQGNTVGERDVELTVPPEPVIPAVPHESLRVDQDITDDAYTFRLLNPDGSDAAPPLVFHRGSPEDGWHGWTAAKVLATLIAHMEYHQGTPFRCDENQIVLHCLQAALRVSKIRADRRGERGVRYDWRRP